MKILVFLITLEVFWGWNNLAQASPVSLETVLQSVDSHYPVLNAARKDVEKSKGDLTSARGGFDTLLKSTYKATPFGEYEHRYFDISVDQPTSIWGTRLVAGYRQGAGKFGPYDEDLLTSAQGEVRGGVQVPLLRGGFIDERRAKIESNEKALQAFQAQSNMQHLEARRQATHRYFDWWASGEKLHIAKSLLELAIKRDQIMTHRVHKGDAANIEQVDNQRSVIQREATKISAQRSVEKAALELSLFYRDAEGQPMNLTLEHLPDKKIPNPPVNELEIFEKKASEFKDILLRHPDLIRLQAQVDQNEVGRQLARNSILPKLDAELLVSQDLNAGDSQKSTLDYKAAIKLEFPLLMRTGRGQTESTTAQGAKLRLQLDMSRDRIRVATQDALQAMRAAQERVRLVSDEVNMSLKVEEAERIKFRQGDSNILTVNLRENNTADARFRIIDALADYYRARADFEVAIAEPLHQDKL